MADMAEWLIDQGIDPKCQQIELSSKAKELEVSQLVSEVSKKLATEENASLLNYGFCSLVEDICAWYEEKNWLSKSQRKCLESAWVELYFAPVGEDNA
ncbi:MAG TPA: hypothetical protein VIQ31_05140 [Phormidium sp.]